MKSKTSRALFFSIGILSIVAFMSQPQYQIENRKQVKALLKKMHFIEGRTFTTGSRAFWKMTEKDSTLLHGHNTRPKVDSYYLNATEVTNIEWWEFYESMRDELGVDKAIELYYPDTEVWTKDFKHTFNLPFTENYFESRDYDDYPVLGISWVQAQAYCKWKTQLLKSAAGRNEELADLTFRLPTQDEWELAASGPPEFAEENRSLYPWGGFRTQKDGKYLANFGIIDDLNMVRVKSLHDDGALYSITVGSYPPNPYGLYDMSGNVAEWVSDTAMMYHGKKKRFTNKRAEIDSLIKDFKYTYPEQYKFRVGDFLHDRDIVIQRDMRLIKGGSWADGLAYLQIGSREAMNKDKKSSRVGFRIAASYDEKYEEYFPKKYWKPKK